MEHSTAAPLPAPPAAAPAVVPVATESVVLSMQKTVGNRAVCRAIASGMLARDDAPTPAGSVAVTGVTVSPPKATMPLEAGTTITAAAKPANASGVKYTLEADTASPAAGTKIDESTGKVTLDAKQPGGGLKAKATSDDGSWADQPFRVIEKPSAIDSTSGSAKGSYEAHFVHTFSSSGASTAGLDGANINEKFDSLTAKTPFDGDFTLQANAAGSGGWDLDGSGKMAGPDKLSISKGGINAGPFVKNASNPAPAKTLPQGFTMTQKLHAKSLPSGTLDASPFTTTPHVRTLEEKDGKLVFTISAGQDSVSIPYAGPAVFRNATADQTTVQASPPKPKTGTWKRNEVQVSVDAEPAGSATKFSFVGDALGCSVNASGKVLIGDKTGKITVRAGNATNYDEVSITITAPPAPVATPPAKGASSEPEAGSEAVPEAAPPDQGTPET